MAKGPKEGIYRSPASSDVEMIYNVHNVQSGKTKSAFLWEPVPSFIENKKEIKKCIFPDGFHQLVLQCTKQWKRQPALRLDQVSPQKAKNNYIFVAPEGPSVSFQEFHRQAGLDIAP